AAAGVNVFGDEGGDAVGGFEHGDVADAVDDDAVGGSGELAQVATGVDAVGNDAVGFGQQQADRSGQRRDVVHGRGAQAAEDHRHHGRAVQGGGDHGGEVGARHRGDVLAQQYPDGQLDEP